MSLPEWPRILVPGLIVALALVLGGLSCRDAGLAYWRGHASDEVPAIFAGDPQIVVTRAEAGLAVAGLADPASRSFNPAKVEANARLALREDPLNATALFELGVALEQERAGDGLAALALSEKLSRREAATQIELERLSALNGNIPSAMAHLDRMFSVSPELAERLMPGVALSLGNPAVLAEAGKYARRGWFPDLIGAAIDAGVSPAGVRGLLGAARGHCDPSVLESLNARLLVHAVTAHDYGAARDVIAHLPVNMRMALGSAGFSAASTDPRLAPLGWALANGIGKGASLAGGDGLALTIAPEQAAILAERVTLIEPGRYDVTQTIAYDAAFPRAALIWDIACEPAMAQPIWHQPVPDRPGSTTYRSTITIPPGCLAQHWRLVASGRIGQQASRGQIHQLMLTAKGGD